MRWPGFRDRRCATSPFTGRGHCASCSTTGGRRERALIGGTGRPGTSAEISPRGSAGVRPASRPEQACELVGGRDDLRLRLGQRMWRGRIPDGTEWVPDCGAAARQGLQHGEPAERDGDRRVAPSCDMTSQPEIRSGGSCAGSGHRRQLSQETVNTCGSRRTAMSKARPTGHPCPIPREPDPRCGRRPRRRAPSLGLPRSRPATKPGGETAPEPLPATEDFTRPRPPRAGAEPQSAGSSTQDSSFRSCPSRGCPTTTMRPRQRMPADASARSGRPMGSMRSEPITARPGPRPSAPARTARRRAPPQPSRSEPSDSPRLAVRRVHEHTVATGRFRRERHRRARLKVFRRVRRNADWRLERRVARRVSSGRKTTCAPAPTARPMLPRHLHQLIRAPRAKRAGPARPARLPAPVGRRGRASRVRSA